jgi:hypothetical protein
MTRQAGDGENRVPVAVRNVALELTLGLAPEDAHLRLDSGSLRADLQPWLLDAAAVRISCLGHHDDAPRPWDWENVLTLLEPGEELLYVLDHRAAQRSSVDGRFDLSLVIRFAKQSRIDHDILALREKRVRVLVSQLQRQAFPGSEVAWMAPDELLSHLSRPVGPTERCVAVTGMPSPRSLEDGVRDIDRTRVTRNDQSLNDVAEALYDLNADYRIAFVVERVAKSELEGELALKTALYDRIHPLVEWSVREGENWSKQLSESFTRAEAVSNTSTVQSSKTRGHNINAGPVGAAIGGAIGFALGGGPPGMIVGATLGSLAGVVSFNRGETKGESNTESNTQTDTEGRSSSEGWGGSADVTGQHLNSMLRLAEGSLQRSIEAMHEASGSGAFRWGVFAFADGHNADIVGRSLMGVLSGSRSKDHPLVRISIEGERNRLLTRQVPTMRLLAQAAPILSLPRVCDALLVPEAELPGLRLRRNVFFGRHVDAEPDQVGIVELGPDAFSSVGADAVPSSVRMPGGDLFRHVLVAGTTGSGKTTRVVEILNRLTVSDLSVVVFETAKRTYRTRFQRESQPAPLVLTLGNSRTYGQGSRFRPLRINPFFFELGTSLKRHIAVLSEAITELVPTEAMIGPLLRSAVEQCYAQRGWDIESGLPHKSSAPMWPTIVDFVVEVRRVASILNYGAEVNANYRGALESRAGIFLDATFQDIFGYGGNLPIDELFPRERDVIVEVEDLPPSEIDIRAFVMTLFLSRLRSVQGSRQHHPSNHTIDNGAESGSVGVNAHTSGRQVLDTYRRWLVVIEEAHNVLDRQFEQRRPSDESNGGRTLLRSVVRLLQEGREMGIGVMVIDQSPTRLARDVIANTGTKIIMRLEDSAEMAEVGGAMGLDEESWAKLGYLQVGEALIKAAYMDNAAKSAGYSEEAMSKRPGEIEPPNECYIPAYAELSVMWRELFEGRDSRRDASWVEQALRSANGNLHLMLFVGLRTLLTAYPSRFPHALTSMSTLMAEAQPTAERVLDLACEIWTETVARSYGASLSVLAAGLCNSIVPSSSWRRGTPTADSILFGANVIARVCGSGADAWEPRLRLASQPASRLQTLRRVSMAISTTEVASLEIAITSLLSLNPAISRFDSKVEAPHVAEFYDSICESVESQLLADNDQLGHPVPEQVETLVVRIVDRLVKQVASRWGNRYTSEVSKLMSGTRG